MLCSDQSTFAHHQGDWRGVGVLHRRLDRLLLPEDAPRHARPPHPQRHRPDRQQHVRVDARQVPGQFTLHTNIP